MNRGEYTEYRAAGAAYNELLSELTSHGNKKEEKNAQTLIYHPGTDNSAPAEYRAMISRYFQILSE